MKMLVEDSGFLKVVAKNPFGVYICRIDIETVEHFVSEHMKEKLRLLTILDLLLREEEVCLHQDTIFNKTTNPDPIIGMKILKSLDREKASYTSPSTLASACDSKRNSRSLKD